MPQSILKYSKVVIFITVALLILSLYLIPRLKADYQFENFFPKGDEQVAFFENYSNHFDSDEDLLMVAYEQDSTVFQYAFLNRIEILSDSLERFSGIREVFGIHNYSDFVKSPFGLIEVKVLKIENEDFSKAEERFASDPRINKLLISEDQKVLNLLISLAPEISEEKSSELIERIKKTSQQLNLPSPKFGGSIYTESSYIAMLESENIRLIPLFVLAVVVAMLCLYRSFFSIIIPTLSVLIGLVLLYGYAAGIGRNINLSTLMYPTIMAVVGMSDLIHLYTKYQQGMAQGLSKKASILSSLKELRVTLFLTSLTTAIGFLSISWTSIPHIKTFGLDAAIGVVIAYVLAITLVPILLNYLPRPRQKSKNDYWDKILVFIYQVTRQYRKGILAFFSICILLSLVGLQRIDTNNYLMGAIDEGAELSKDFRFFENKLSGIRAFELALEMQGENRISDFAVIHEIEKLEKFLQSWPELGPVFSPLTFYKSVQSIEKGGKLKNYKLPENPTDLRKAEEWRKRIDDPFVATDFKMGRITAKMKDIGRLEVQERLKELDIWTEDNLNLALFNIRPTGVHLLIDRTNELMINKLGSGLLLAFLIISIIVGLLFRNLQMILISLVPNLLPLLITAGFMGFLGIELNGSSAIIFTIAFVIAVDDTIHFLKKYQLEYLTLKNKEEAIKATLLQAGKSIISTSVVLIAGYSILLFSDFKEAYYHGVLICLTLFWAVVADLFLLPVLLRMTNQKLALAQ